MEILKLICGRFSIGIFCMIFLFYCCQGYSNKTTIERLEHYFPEIESDSIIVCYYKWWEEKDSTLYNQLPNDILFNFLDSNFLSDIPFYETMEHNEYQFFGQLKLKLGNEIFGYVIRTFRSTPYSQSVDLFIFDSKKDKISNHLQLAELVAEESFNLRMYSQIRKLKNYSSYEVTRYKYTSKQNYSTGLVTHHEKDTISSFFLENGVITSIVHENLDSLKLDFINKTKLNF